MLKVTRAARELLSEMLVELQPREGNLVRIVVSGVGLSLVIGPIQSGDRIVHHDAKSVLAIAQGVSDDDHRTLDVVTTIRGPDLRIVAGERPSGAKLRVVQST